MFGFLRRLLGKDKGQAAISVTPAAQDTQVVQAVQIAQAAQVSPPQTGAARTKTPEQAGGTRSFICRELILDRQQQIAGYAFDLPKKLRQRLLSNPAAGSDAQDAAAASTRRRAYGDALLRSLCGLDLPGLLGDRLAVVQLSTASLTHPLLAQLPAHNTILMLSLDAETTLDASAEAALQEQLDTLNTLSPLNTLRQRGLKLGWQLRKQQLSAQPALLKLASQADLVQFQTGDFDGVEIKTLIKLLGKHRPPGLPDLQLMAHELDSFDEFNLCFQSGFDFFLGDFISRRDNWHPPKSDINRLLVIKLLNLLRSDTELNLIAPQLTGDPVLSFKLLRYLNSPAMGLQSPVSTMDKALLVLGRARFYRWLSLLLFDVKAPGYRERVLIEQALTRAFFLETLAAQGYLPKDRDELFLLGLFSMLDLLIGQPLASILDQARLSQPVHEALLGEPGAYRDALNLAAAAEDQYAEQLEAHSLACGLEAQQVTQASIEALAKAREIAALSEHQ